MYTGKDEKERKGTMEAEGFSVSEGTGEEHVYLQRL